MLNELLADFKLHLGEDSGVDDRIIMNMLKAAIALIEIKIARKIIGVLLEEAIVVNDGGVGFQFAPNEPIIPINGRDFLLDSSHFTKTSPYIKNGTLVRVAYNVGYSHVADIPHDLKHAIFLAGTYLYENRGDAITRRESGGTNQKQAIVTDPIIMSGAHALLSPYMGIAI